MFILQVNPANIWGVNGQAANSGEAQNADTILLETLSTATRPVEKAGAAQPVQQEQLLGHIMDLVDKYIQYAKTHPPGNDRQLSNPPWMNSNDLFDTLAKFTGFSAPEENINAIKTFFNKMMEGKSFDPNNDGKTNYKDVIALWKGAPLQKGDINNDGNINQTDVHMLTDALAVGDMNNDGKLDLDDYKELKKIIDSTPQPVPLREGDEIIRPVQKGDFNHDGILDIKDLKTLGKLLTSGDMNNDKKIDAKDLELLIKIAGDNPPPPPPPTPTFPVCVDIDLDKDGKHDFTIRHNKLYTVFQGEDGFEHIGDEVQSIPGVDLNKLAKDIENLYHTSDLAGNKLEFDMDINNDGKMDHIYTWNPPTPVKQ